ncbi:Uncharacterised protein [uncultured archaeon]|nr:Uncharacterised protein [uncultured archaeon]
MIKPKLEGDKLSLPMNIMQKAGLVDGDEVEVRLEEGNVAIKSLINMARFKKELSGCIEGSNFDPLLVKKIWKA